VDAEIIPFNPIMVKLIPEELSDLPYGGPASSSFVLTSCL
jgi:hypothetical protein